MPLLLLQTKSLLAMLAKSLQAPRILRDAPCRSDNSWQAVVDVIFCAAMGPPGGGRNPVTHATCAPFNLIAISDFDDATYSSIYGVRRKCLLQMAVGIFGQLRKGGLVQTVLQQTAKRWLV